MSPGNSELVLFWDKRLCHGNLVMRFLCIVDIHVSVNNVNIERVAVKDNNAFYLILFS